MYICIVFTYTEFQNPLRTLLLTIESSLRMSYNDGLFVVDYRQITFYNNIIIV